MTRGDAIINCGSITGLEGSKELLDYSSTKGAIHAFTKSLAQNLVDKGIRVNCVVARAGLDAAQYRRQAGERGRQARRRHADGAAGAARRDRAGVCVLRVARRFELHHGRGADAARWRDHCGIGVCRAHPIRSGRHGWTATRRCLYNRWFLPSCAALRAEVAELADAQASGACARKGVEVRVLSSAPAVTKAGSPTTLVMMNVASRERTSSLPRREQPAGTGPERRLSWPA